MKKFFKYAALIVAVLMVSGSAWAWNSDFHIAQAPNNKGDAMIFPWFLAADGGFWSTVTVINTDQKNSVVAKVVARSYKNSEELLDFLIYLSPGDVWKGIIYQVGPVTGFYSDDDSIVIDSAGTFATPAKPFNFPMFPVQCAEDATSIGYLEVIEAAIGPVAPAMPGVKKSDIYAAYNPGISNAKFLYTPFDAYVDWGIVNELTAPIDPNVLAGFIEFGSPLNGLTTAFSATTFINYLNYFRLPPNLETVFGQDCDNSLAEIEAALAKNNIAMPYVSGTDNAIHLITFPTKHSTPRDDCKVTNVASPFFNENANNEDEAEDDYCLAYSTTNFDLMEKFNSTPVSGNDQKAYFCSEVNFLAPNEFPAGWSNYVFTYFGDPNDIWTYGSTKSDEQIYYEGAPALVTWLFNGPSGLSSGYGAWTDSFVSYDFDTPGYYFYQYASYPYTPIN